MITLENVIEIKLLNIKYYYTDLGNIRCGTCSGCKVCPIAHIKATPEFKEYPNLSCGDVYLKSRKRFPYIYNRSIEELKALYPELLI